MGESVTIGRTSDDGESLSAEVKDRRYDINCYTTKRCAPEHRIWFRISQKERKRDKERQYEKPLGKRGCIFIKFLCSMFAENIFYGLGKRISQRPEKPYNI